MAKPRKFRREPKKFRAVTLLSSGQTARIDPSQYRAHTNLKRFDDDTTEILRVHRSAPAERPDTDPPDHYLVYGKRAVKNPKGSYRCNNGDYYDVVEVYDIAINEEMVPGLLEAVAAHCGIEDLLKPAS